MSPPTCVPSQCWHSMMSAPKDGTRILAVSWGDVAEVVYFDPQQNFWLTIPGRYGREPRWWSAIPALTPRSAADLAVELQDATRERDRYRAALALIARTGRCEDARDAADRALAPEAAR